MEQRGRQSINGSSGAPPRARSASLPTAALVVAGCGLTALLPAPLRAQSRAEVEVEVERRDDATTTRLEFSSNSFYFLRAERTRSATDPGVDRLGLQFPGMLGLEGYGSLFLEDRPGRTGVGTNFEYGRGPMAVGGSVERGAADFTGAYLKLRGGDLELSFGGGSRDGRGVAHGAAYARGTRYSLVWGGSFGPDEAAYSHVAGTWHPGPDQRGRVPGAWFGFERDGPDDYAIELNVAHRATFGYLTSWGAYGMDQWPHEKRIEAVGDVMRYFRPSIRNHERSAGVGVLGLQWERTAGARTVTLDTRVFPFRFLPRWSRQPLEDEGRDILHELLRGAMAGLVRPLHPGPAHVLLELRVRPVAVYAEVPTHGPTPPYLFVQYILRLPS